MIGWSTRLLAAVTTLAAAIAPAYAQVAPGPSEVKTPDPLYTGRLFGDADGRRTRMNEAGVSIGLLEQSEVLGNLTGGIHRGATYEGVTSLGLGIDTQRAFGWSGGTFNVSAFQFHGRGLSQSNVPDLTAVSGIEQTTRGFRLFELWYEQVAFDGMLAIRVGQMSVDEEFMTTLYGGLFVNAGYGFPTLGTADLPSSGVDYPLAAPGVRLKLVPSEHWSLLAGVFNGDPAGRGPGDPQQRDGGGTAFRLNDGVFAIAEVQYGSAPGLYKLGAWYQSEAFADPRTSFTGQSLADPSNTAAARARQGDYSVYATADRLVWSKPGTPDGGLAVFTRIMAAPPDRNLVDAFVQAGVTDRAPLPGRDSDTMGIAVSWSHLSAPATKLASDRAAFTGHPVPERRAETMIELTYQAQATPWMQVQPDVQYVLDPGGGIPNAATGRRVGDALVLGVRTNITF